MSTRSTSNDLVSPLSNPESVIRHRRRNLGDPSLLLNFEEINMNHNNVQGPPPVGPPPQNHNGPPGLDLQNPAPDLRTMEELLTLRHHDTINAAAGGTFMKRRPKECYDLIKNMTAHHNDWDTSSHRGESSSSTTSSSSKIASLDPDLNEVSIPRVVGDNDLGDHTCPVYYTYVKLQSIPNPREEIKAITTRSGNILVGPSVPLPPLSSSSKEVERDPEMITDQLPPSLVSKSSELPKQNPHQPPIPYPSRLNKEKLQDKSDIQVHKFLQMFKKRHFNISLAEL
ncbi:hypothetical protein Tco_0990937 [Tanacetum coccineum]|uniref:Reverse transcriptase domain-containing protein n=1 Tax=Tanacetum coccineum TaxID=301880 RepID=A0ABQ5EYL5_9ASTR